MNVIKRDGKVVTYDIHRIHSAILNAMRDVQDVDFDMVNILTDLVESQIHQEDTITVEKIQDIVEDVLSKHAPAVYKHFHEYRAERTRIRESKSPVSKMIDELVNTDSNDSDLKRENANVNTDSTMGTMLKVGSEICRKQFLDKYMRPRHAAKHREGYYHIHDMDLGLLTVNCIYIPLGKLLDRGFNTGHGYIRPPKTVSSAASLACIILQSNQNEMYGGQAFACFEYALAKYVAKSYVRHVLGICQILHDLSDDIVKPVIDRLDDYVIKHTHIMRTEEGLKVVDGELNSLGISTSEHFDKIIPIAYKKTVEETKQAMEALVYNFNTMHARSGAQVPFSSLNYGTDTSTEGRIVISAILDAIDAGLGTGETALFPISIFRMKKGITDKGSPNYDLFKKACRVSARRLYPNFLSLDSSFNLPYYHEGHPETYAAAMGCSDGTGVITVRHENDYPFSICFEDFVKLKDNTAYKVWDSHAGKFVKINKVIANPPTDKWIEFTFSNGKILTLTPDHYLPINGVRTRVDNAKIGDAVPVGEYPTFSKPSIAVITKIEHKLMVKPSYCLETETDMFDLNGMQSHNCRTRVLGNDYDPKQQITEGRGNLFSVTLSLPFLALLAKENLTKISSKFTKEELISEFMKLVTDNVNDIFTEMDDRFEMICKRKVKNYPFLMGQDIYLGSGKLSYEDSIRSSLMHGTRTVGFIGLAECLTALIGKHHGESEEAQKLGLKIVKHMYDMCKYRSEKLHINYSLMGSPAEGCTGRLAKCAAKRFGVIPGVTDKKYFTNSSHVPPRYHISAYDKVKVEAPYHKYELAGAISYIEYPGDPAKNVKAFEELVTYMANSDMGYFSINHPVMHDPVCGYTGAPNPDGTCPNCGRKPGEGMPAWKLSRVQKLATTDIKYRINARDLI